MTYMRIFEKIKNIVKKNEGVYKNQRQYYDLKSSELCALYEGIRENLMMGFVVPLIMDLLRE